MKGTRSEEKMAEIRAARALKKLEIAQAEEDFSAWGKAIADINSNDGAPESCPTKPTRKEDFCGPDDGSRKGPGKGPGKGSRKKGAISAARAAKRLYKARVEAEFPLWWLPIAYVNSGPHH